MKTLLATLGIIIALFANGTTITAQTSGKLEVVGGDVYDWGKVAPGTLSATLEIRNAGTGTLNITDVQRSCGCTTAPIDKNVLLPNEKATIAVSIDAASKQGVFERTITIHSDDPNNKAQIVRLKAIILRDYTVSPASYMMINDGLVGVESKQTLHITNTGETPLVISAPTLESGNVKVRFESKDKIALPVGAETTLTYYVTPLGNKPEDGKPIDYSINGVIVYKISSASSPELRINVYGSTAPSQSQVVPAQPQTVVSPSLVSPELSGR